MSEVRLRRAQTSDAATLLEWRNDPWVLSRGSQGRAVSPSEHAAWFARTLASPDHLLLIIETAEHGGIGSVRFDREPTAAAEVSIYLLRPHTGRGLGVAALREACTVAFERWPEVERIVARVLPENAQSLRAFEKAGFDVTRPRSGNVKEPGVLTLTLDRRAWIARLSPSAAGENLA